MILRSTYFTKRSIADHDTAQVIFYVFVLGSLLQGQDPVFIAVIVARYCEDILDMLGSLGWCEEAHTATHQTTATVSRFCIHMHVWGVNHPMNRYSVPGDVR